MRVSRFTQAYGKNYRTPYILHGSVGEAIWGPGIPPKPVERPYAVDMAIAFRDTPKDGGRIGEFRLPTQWFMLAGMADGSGDFDFTLAASNGIQKYRFTGNGPTPPFMGVPRWPYVNTTAKTVDISTNLSNRARVEALNKIKDQEINIGAALGESRETLAHLASTVSRLVKAVRAVKRGAWDQLPKALGIGKGNAKDSSSAWLEYQYGWMPLISDIYGAQEQLKKGFREKDQVFSVTRQVEGQLDHYLLCNPQPSPTDYDIQGKLVEKCRVVYFQKVSNAKLYALNQLGVVNPLAIAWELVPFSFVIDWLVPIGNFLDGITSTLGTDFIAGFEDRIIEGSMRWKYKGHPAYSLVAGEYPGPNTNRMFAFERRVFSTWALPVPYWKNPFSTSHVASALALVTQLRK